MSAPENSEDKATALAISMAIKRLRQHRELNSKDFAAAVGWSESQVQHLENSGEDLTVSQLIEMNLKLGENPAWFLQDIQLVKDYSAKGFHIPKRLKIFYPSTPEEKLQVARWKSIGKETASAAQATGATMQGLRERLGLRISDFAAKLGMTSLAVRGIERARRDLKVSKLFALSRSLNEKPGKLLDRIMLRQQQIVKKRKAIDAPLRKSTNLSEQFSNAVGRSRVATVTWLDTRRNSSLSPQPELQKNAEEAHVAEVVPDKHVKERPMSKIEQKELTQQAVRMTLQRIRKDHNLSQTQLSEKIGWKPDTVLNLEGSRAQLSIPQLLELTRAMGEDPGAFMSEIARNQQEVEATLAAEQEGMEKPDLVKRFELAVERARQRTETSLTYGREKARLAEQAKRAGLENQKEPKPELENQIDNDKDNSL